MIEMEVGVDNRCHGLMSQILDLVKQGRYKSNCPSHRSDFDDLGPLNLWSGLATDQP